MAFCKIAPHHLNMVLDNLLDEQKIWEESFKCCEECFRAPKKVQQVPGSSLKLIQLQDFWRMAWCQEWQHRNHQELYCWGLGYSYFQWWLPFALYGICRWKSEHYHQSYFMPKVEWYQNILVFPNHRRKIWWLGGCLFQHDGAPCHKQKWWLNGYENKTEIFGPCPGNCPALNSIENVWSILRDGWKNKLPNLDKFQAFIV